MDYQLNKKRTTCKRVKIYNNKVINNFCKTKSECFIQVFIKK